MKQYVIFTLSFLLCMSLPFSDIETASAAEKNEELKEKTLAPADASESVGIKAPEGMIFVKGGCYDMGDTFNDGDVDEKPVHTVCLDDFFIGKYEVTNAEFEVFANETSYKTAAEKTGAGWGVSKKGATDWSFKAAVL